MSAPKMTAIYGERSRTIFTEFPPELICVKCKIHLKNGVSDYCSDCQRRIHLAKIRRHQKLKGGEIINEKPNI